MPWGAIIIGAFLIGGATVGINHYITGTASIDGFIRTGVPIALAGIFAIVLITGLFGGKN